MEALDAKSAHWTERDEEHYVIEDKLSEAFGKTTLFLTDKIKEIWGLCEAEAQKQANNQTQLRIDCIDEVSKVTTGAEEKIKDVNQYLQTAKAHMDIMYTRMAEIQ